MLGHQRWSTVFSRDDMRRFAVFAVVGGINTALCYALFAALVCAGVHYNLALVADYSLGTATGFVLQRTCTFADRQRLKQPFGKYVLTFLTVFGLHLGLLDALVQNHVLSPLPGQAVALTVATLFSFMLQKSWVFRSSGPEPRNHQRRHVEDRVPAEQTAET